jgi:hypothetical protein
MALPVDGDDFTTRPFNEAQLKQGQSYRGTLAKKTIKSKHATLSLAGGSCLRHGEGFCPANDSRCIYKNTLSAAETATLPKGE